MLQLLGIKNKTLFCHLGWARVSEVAPFLGRPPYTGHEAGPMFPGQLRPAKK